MKNNGNDIHRWLKPTVSRGSLHKNTQAFLKKIWENAEKLGSLSQLFLLIAAILGIIFTYNQVAILNEQLKEQIWLNSPIITFSPIVCVPIIGSNSFVKTIMDSSFIVGNAGNSPLIYAISFSSGNLKFKLENSLECKEFSSSCQIGVRKGNLKEGGFGSAIPPNQERTFNYFIEIPPNLTEVNYKILVLESSTRFKTSEIKEHEFNCDYSLNKTENDFRIFVSKENIFT